MRLPGLFTPFLLLTGYVLSSLGGCSQASEAPRPAAGESRETGSAESGPRGDVVQTAADEGHETGDHSMSLTIQSPAFENNAAIPARFTDDGEDVSPQLSWSGVPEGAKELALIMDDPDAPTAEPWVHWVIYKIPAGVTGLPENVAKSPALSAPAGALQGKNSWGRVGYGGPAPPRGHGVHHYHFRLYALGAALDVKPGLTKARLLSAMEGHILAQGELVGTYQR